MAKKPEKKDLKKELEKLDKALKGLLKSFENLEDFEDEKKALVLKVFLSATDNKLKAHLESL